MTNQNQFTFQHVGEIERRAGLTNDEFTREYVVPGRPVVLTDAVDGWPALAKWTPTALKKHYGERKVRLKKHYGDVRDTPDRELSFAEYIDMVLASSAEEPAPYLFGFEIRDLFPELLPDMEPAIRFTQLDRLHSNLHPLRFKLPRLTEMLIGGAGTKFPLHFDYLQTHGFVTQVYGDKEFTIFSPLQSEYLYPNPEYPNRSLISDIFDPDLQQYPLLTKARPLRVVLRAGETIYHPCGWWHTTRLLTPSIGIVRSTVFANNWLRFVDDYCSVRPAPLKTQLKAILRLYLLGIGPVMWLSESFRKRKLSFGKQKLSQC